MRVTRTAGNRRKEGAKHIKTYSPSHGRKPGQRGVNRVLGVVWWGMARSQGTHDAGLHLALSYNAAIADAPAP